MGDIKVKLDMPGHRNEGDGVNGREHDKFYRQTNQWLDGENDI